MNSRPFLTKPTVILFPSLSAMSLQVVDEALSPIYISRAFIDFAFSYMDVMHDVHIV